MMLGGRGRWLLTAAALSLCLGGCNRNKPKTTGGDGAEVAQRTGRMQTPPRTPVGAQPGYLEGGVFYAAVRPHQVQTWLQHIPIEPRAARDLAEAGQVIGMDLRSDNVAQQWGIDAAAVISMTWFRPLSPGNMRDVLASESSSAKPGAPDPFAGMTRTEEAKAKAEEQMRALEAEAKRAQEAAAKARQAVEAAPDPGAMEEPVPLGDVAYEPDPLPPPPPPSPPPPHPLTSKAEALAFHSRIHVPVTDLGAFKRQLTALPRESMPESGRELCASFNGELLCYADRGTAVLVREDQGAVLVDFYVFPMRAKNDSKAPGRAEVVRTSRSAQPAQLPVLATLAGDAVGYLDGAAIPKAHEVAKIASAFRRLQWDEQRDVGEKFKRTIRDITALEQLRDVRRLFSGVTFEGTVGERDVHLTTRWVPADDDARKLSAELFERPDVAVSVPSLAALCDGSVMCMRTTGLPDIKRFGELATGVYGAKEREFSRTLNHADEMAALSMFAETWPNAIGAAQRWPAMELEGKPEGGIILGVIDAVSRIEGAGGSLRSLHFGKRNMVHSDFVAYLRLPKSDANLVRTMLAFAELTFAPATVAGINQKVEAVTIPDSDMPASLYMISGEPPVKVTRDQKTEDVEFGWLAVADSGDRISWMLTQAMETTTQPAFYFEIPNLWNLIGSFPGAQREVNFARTWLSGQAVKIAVDVVDGAPQIDAAFEASTAATIEQPLPPPEPEPIREIAPPPPPAT